MGDSITEGTVVQWTKEAGESVEIDEVVVVLETDKVSSVTVRLPLYCRLITARVLLVYR